MDAFASSYLQTVCRITVGRNEYMIAERHLRAVRHDQIVIGIKVVADCDMISVVAPKRWRNADFFPHFTQNLREQCLLSVAVVGVQSIISIAFVLACGDFFFKIGILTTLKQAIDRYGRSAIHGAGSP